MRLRAPVIAVLVLGLTAATCGGTDPAAALDLDQYVEQMQEFREAFLREVPGSEGTGPPDSGYPIGGDLVGATALYTAYDELLSDWEKIAPPAEVAAEHQAMISALDALQKAIGSYLGHEAIETGELDFASIGRNFQAELGGVFLACSELQAAVSQSNGGEVFGDCSF